MFVFISFMFYRSYLKYVWNICCRFYEVDKLVVIVWKHGKFVFFNSNLINFQIERFEMVIPSIGDQEN